MTREEREAGMRELEAIRLLLDAPSPERTLWDHELGRRGRLAVLTLTTADADERQTLVLAKWESMGPRDRHRISRGLRELARFGALVDYRLHDRLREREDLDG